MRVRLLFTLVFMPSLILSTDCIYHNECGRGQDPCPWGHYCSDGQCIAYICPDEVDCSRQACGPDPHCGIDCGSCQLMTDQYCADATILTTDNYTGNCLNSGQGYYCENLYYTKECTHSCNPATNSCIEDSDTDGATG